MDDKSVDYHIDEDLEQLFHSDLQNLVLRHEETSHDDVIGDHLPEWLVGVIVVIAMLIVAFFIMIITSLVKSRRKHRNSTHTGNGSHSTCDDLESGKIGHRDDQGMKMTSFSSVTEGSTPPQSVIDANDRDPLTSVAVGSVIGVQGCKNPLFVDDSDDNNSDGKEVITGSDESKDKTKISPSNNRSASNSSGGSDATVRSKGMSHKYKPSNSKRSVTSTKAEQHGGDKAHDSDGEARKRIFASKVKGGSQTSSKRWRMNGTSLNDSITSQSDEKRDSEETGEVTKVENNTRFLTDVNSGLHLHDNETNACCEDSGVELSCQESQIKDETGGGSESDELSSRLPPGISPNVRKECDNDHEMEVVQSDVTFSDKSCPSGSLLNKANKSNVFPPSADVYQERDQSGNVCSQSSSADCGSDTYVLAGHIHQEERQSEDHILGNMSIAAELQLLDETNEVTTAASQPRLNMTTAKMTISSKGEDEKATLRETCLSNLQSDDEADHIVLDKSYNPEPSNKAICRTTTSIGQVTNKSTERVEITNKSTEGVEVTNKSTEGVEVTNKSTEGIEVINKSTEGVEVTNKSTEGVEVTNKSTEGIEVINKSTEGVEVTNKSVTENVTNSKSTVEDSTSYELSNVENCHDEMDSDKSLSTNL